MENATNNGTAIPRPRASVELHKNTHHLKLGLNFARKPAAGPLVALDTDFVYRVEPMNELAVTYTMTNWMSGIISGVAYTSRKLKLPDTRVYVEQLEGKLGSADMGAIANAAAIAVAMLAGKECPSLEMDGWTGQWSIDGVDHEIETE